MNKSKIKLLLSGKKGLLVSLIFYFLCSITYYNTYIYEFNPFVIIFLQLLLWGTLVLTYNEHQFLFFDIILFCYGGVKLFFICSPEIYHKIQIFIC